MERQRQSGGIRDNPKWIFREQRRQVDSAKKITHRETETRRGRQGETQRCEPSRKSKCSER